MKQRQFVVIGVWAAWACGVGLAMSTACGSDDSARKSRRTPSDAGAGGEPDASSGGRAGQGVDAGSGGDAPSGVAGQNEPAGGAPLGGAPTGAGGVLDAGAPGTAGSPGAAGTAGATSCASPDPSTLQGFWTSDCNGYTCSMYIAASGAVSNGCSNRQFESGTLEQDGTLTTAGEGGGFQPYTTDGSLVPSDCDMVTRDYTAQAPPDTGPITSYSCQLVRSPACAPTLLEALVGEWTTNCGTSICTSTIDAEGTMISTCSNGQNSAGEVDETGAFTTLGSGGNFPAYSTYGVIALTGCDSFRMPYIYQVPANTGNKTSTQCIYTRVVDT